MIGAAAFNGAGGAGSSARATSPGSVEKALPCRSGLAKIAPNDAEDALAANAKAANDGNRGAGLDADDASRDASCTSGGGGSSG